jgi:predicted MFS family arabinose efflux permease
VNFFYGIAIVVLPCAAKTYICDEAYGYGSLLVCSSLGGVVGTFLIGRVKEAMKHYNQITALCLMIAGISWIGMTLTLDKQVILSYIFIFISNMAICMMNIVFVVLIQKNIEEHLLGRVSTLTESMASNMIPVGNFVGGILLIYFNELYLEAVYGFALIICSLAYFINNNSKMESKI